MVLSRRSEAFFKRWKSRGGEKQLLSRYERTEQDQNEGPMTDNATDHGLLATVAVVTVFGIGIDVVENPRIAEAIRLPGLAFARRFSGVAQDAIFLANFIESPPGVSTGVGA